MYHAADIRPQSAARGPKLGINTRLEFLERYGVLFMAVFRVSDSE